MDITFIVFLPFFMSSPTPANCNAEEYMLKGRVQSLNMQLRTASPRDAKVLKELYARDYDLAKVRAQECVDRLKKS